MVWQWRLSEYLLRGVFLTLTLWAGASTQLVHQTFALWASAIVPVLVLLGERALRARPSRSIQPAQVLLALIDHPIRVHLGAAIGLAVGCWVTFASPLAVLITASAGLLIGFIVYRLHRIRSARLRRLGMGLFLTTILLSGSLALQQEWITGDSFSRPAGLLLVGLALLYYVLVFAGESEESEFDIGLCCLVLALGLAEFMESRTGRAIVLLLPVGLYVFYSERARVGLVVFKHIVRGMGHDQNKRWPEALVEYRLALAADPSSKAAAEGSWNVHQRIDVESLAARPEWRQLIDPAACLGRVRDLLHAPTLSAERAREADRLLALVDECAPDRHWESQDARVQLCVARQQEDQAEQIAQSIVLLTSDDLAKLSPTESEHLLAVWTFLLRDPMLQSLGSKLLETDRGVPALMSLVERRLVQHPNDQTAAGFRPFLARKLNWNAFSTARDLPGSLPFPMLHVPSLLEAARSLVLEEVDLIRSVDLFRIVAHEQPAERLAMLSEAAQVADRLDPTLAHSIRMQIHDDGLRNGFASLESSERAAFDQTIRVLATQAEHDSNTSEAIRLWEIFAASAMSGWQTRRRLFDLYQQLPDPLQSIRQVTALLLYDLPPEDREAWIQKRNGLYAEINPETVRTHGEQVRRYFDYRYCARRAAQLFEQGHPREQIDHYLALAELGPASELRFVNYVLGKQHKRDGTPGDAARCWEAVCETPPTAAADEEERLIYQRTCRLLGELYVEQLNEPTRGLHFLHLYRDHLESGADTLYLIGKAYEMLGDRARARKWYDMVTVYSSHPKAELAREALRRLPADSTQETA